MREGLTFDDVLLVPQYSEVASRSGVDTTTWLTPRIRLAIPIVASNMDTVCESEMAIAMARLGGIGIIHRFLSIGEQAEEVRKVKDAENIVILEPYTIDERSNASEARDLMIEKNISSLLVVDAAHLIGILTLKMLTLEPLNGDLVTEFMTPVEDMITASPSISIEEAKEIMRANRVGKLPLIENGLLRGLITRKDILDMGQYPMATKDSKGRLRCGAAIGVGIDCVERAEALIQSGVDVIVVDIAHGHSFNCIRVIHLLKDKYGKDIQIIAGNVATLKGAKDLAKVGADAIKVGVGPGSICTTRIVTGHGVPQLTAIMDCNQIDVPIIADGGIQTSGDIVKAIAAGADTVMLGSLLAGTEESPGEFIHRNGQRCKVVRGMASYGAALGRESRNGDAISSSTPEGVEGIVPYRGHTHEVIGNLLGGVRSGMSYSGVFVIKELQERTEFIKITQAGRIESQSHDIQSI